MSELTSELAELRRQFEAAKAEASSLVEGLSGPQFNWRPDPHSWSIAECILHLNMVGSRSVVDLERILDEARARGRAGGGPFGYGWFGTWILKNTEPPAMRKFHTSQRFQPIDDQPVRAVLPTFVHLQDQLNERLEQANGLDLAHIKVPAPVFSSIKVNLLVMLAWIAAHERRHLWQARQVRNHAVFPKAPA